MIPMTASHFISDTGKPLKQSLQLILNLIFTWEILTLCIIHIPILITFLFLIYKYTDIYHIIDPEVLVLKLYITSVSLSAIVVTYLGLLSPLISSDGITGSTVSLLFSASSELSLMKKTLEFLNKFT